MGPLSKNQKERKLERKMKGTENQTSRTKAFHCLLEGKEDDKPMLFFIFLYKLEFCVWLFILVLFKNWLTLFCCSALSSSVQTSKGNNGSWNQWPSDLSNERLLKVQTELLWPSVGNFCLRPTAMMLLDNLASLRWNVKHLSCLHLRCCWLSIYCKACQEEKLERPIVLLSKEPFGQMEPNTGELFTLSNLSCWECLFLS